MKMNIKETSLKHGLCIGCGFCAASCPNKAISMEWEKNLTWMPALNAGKCVLCGICAGVCPNTPGKIREYETLARVGGEYFGLNGDNRFYIAYDKNNEKRSLSSSGGALTAVLGYLLEKKYIDGVISASLASAKHGQPHSEIRISRSVDELEKTRSSQYGAVKYDLALEEIKKMPHKYAFVGVPCCLRSLDALAPEMRNKIKYKFGIACSHNVTGRFVDYLAKKAGVPKGENFTANLRDKLGGIADANNFNNCFCFRGKEIRNNRFETPFTILWRNYFFSRKCCLYCPDFFAKDADMSVKDAWGRLSKDALGTSLVTVRNKELIPLLENMFKESKIFLEECDADEVYLSQADTARFKRALRLDTPIALKADVFKYSFSRTASNFFYGNFGALPVKCIVIASKILRHSLSASFICARIVKKIFSGVTFPARHLVWGLIKYPLFSDSAAARKKNGINVLLSGGYGYGNVGDEAQLGAVIAEWKASRPDADITVFSPDPGYTEKTHGVRSVPAPRITFFDAGKNSDYHSSNALFRLRFWYFKARMIFLAKLMRAGKPLPGAYPEEAELLSAICSADVLHFSGGGYLTGLTLSRLWDSMLLIALAEIFGVPVILSGQTIGIFKDKNSKRLAAWGLKKAKLIYLRDASESEEEVRSLGIAGDKVASTFDDALFCDAAQPIAVDACLKTSGLSDKDEYIAVNAHYFRQRSGESCKIMERMASICDHTGERYGKKILLIPMSPSDVEALREIKTRMRSSSRILKYPYDYRLAKGVIARAELLLTMKHHPIIFGLSSKTLTVALSFDDYYDRKNKGAMELFGQEKMFVNREGFFAPGIVEGKIAECFCDEKEIKRVIEEKLCGLKKREGEVIARFLGTKGA